MVRRLLWLFIGTLLFSVLLTACRQVENIKKDETVTIKDYYPFDKNVIKVYQGVGNEFADQTTFIEYADEDRAQIKIYNPASAMVKVVEYENGEIREIYREEEFYHIENKTSSHNIVDNVILKEPLKVGNSWSTPDRHKRTITGMDVDIDTPYGKFKALEVTTEYGENRKQMDYYAKGVGHVATIYVDNGIEIKTLLKDLVREPYKLNMRFYYPTSDLKVVFVEREVSFNTNEDIKNIFERYLKNTGYKELLPVIAEDVKINSIDYDKNEGLVRVDFSEELLSNIATEGYNEVLALKSLVNTFGSYYNVEKVYISVEGKPYSSSLFTLEKDEFFNVDYTNIQHYPKN
jgi:hypothetical protein